MKNRAWLLALLPVLALGCGHFTGESIYPLFFGGDVNSNGFDGPSRGGFGSNVGDVTRPLVDGPTQPIPGAGLFDARVVNASSTSARVTLRFLLVETLVHQTELESIPPETTTMIAGPEMATVLVAGGVAADGRQLPEERFAYGVDVDEDRPAIYVIEDPVVPPPDDDDDDVDTNGPPDDDDDVDTNGPPDDDDDVDTNGPPDDDVDTNGPPDDGGDDDNEEPPPPPLESDCNSNGVEDADELELGSATDCNENGRLDECDISGGTSSDVNANGVPDECDPDCDGNGVPDDYDIAQAAQEGIDLDCNDNGVPDSCDLSAGTAADINDNGVPDKCETDCNSNGVPDDYELASGSAADCNGNGVPDACDIAAGTSQDVNENGTPDSCEPDCDGNGVPDGYEISQGSSADCNTNGVPDTCDLTGGTSEDCDTNGVPDECESPYCPEPEACCFEDGSCLDLEPEVCLYGGVKAGGARVVVVGIPQGPGTSCEEDSCPQPGACCIDDEIECIDVSEPFCFGDFRGEETSCAETVCGPDCQPNGIDDNDEIAAGSAADCNTNGVPDACDIAAGTSLDLDSNGVPDECEGEDCNNNGVLDAIELLEGSATDCDTNGVLDECDVDTDSALDCNYNGTHDACEYTGVNPVASAGADACSDAQPVCPSLYYFGDTTPATPDGSSSCGSSDVRDVWYRYTPVFGLRGEAHTVTISLCQSSFDTVLSVHTGCPGTPENEIACNDDSECYPASFVGFQAVPGTEYFIRISGPSRGDAGRSTGDPYGQYLMVVYGPPCAPEGFDCDANGVLDECDIASSTAGDSNDNGVLDWCEEFRAGR